MNKRARLQRQMEKRREKIYMAVTVYTILNCMGFPGEYMEILGDISDVLVGYSSFALMIWVMLVSSGDRIRDWKILNLKAQYSAIYFMVGEIFLVSMMVTGELREELISCVRFAVIVLYSLWIAEHFKPKEILRVIYYAQILFVILNLIFLVICPESAIGTEFGENYFTGIFSAKNSIASEVSICILLQLLLYRFMREDGEQVSLMFIFTLVMQGIMLIMANSVGAIICMLLPAIYVIKIEKKLGKEKRIPLGIFFIVVNVGFLLTAFTILPLFEPLLQLLGKDATLSQRVPLWRQIIEIMTEHNTFTGFGYNMFWRDPDATVILHAQFARNSFFNYATAGAHNLLMELWLNIGLLGIGVLFLTVIFVMRRIRELDEQQYAFCATYLIWILLHGLVERSLLPSNYQTLFFMIMLGVGCNRSQNTRRKRRDGWYDWK